MSLTQSHDSPSDPPNKTKDGSWVLDISMSSIKKIAKIISINIFLTVSIFFCINLASNVFLFAYTSFRNVQEGSNHKKDRSYLPNYSDNRNIAKIHYQESEETQYQFEAFLGWGPKPYKGEAINIDSEGDRVHTIIDRHQHNSRSVYFFGGSTMFGTGAPDNETIPAIFNSISGIPSLNKGKSGHISRQGVASFISLLAQEKRMDAVVFYDGFNDVVIGCRTELKPNEHSRTQSIRKKLAHRPNPRAEYLDSVFLSGTRSLVTKVYSKLFSSNKSHDIDRALICDESEKRAQGVATALVNNWEILHDIASTRKIKFFAILQPTAHLGNPNVDHIQGYLSSDHQRELGKQLKAVYPIIKRLIRKRGHNWIFDYTEAFSRNEYIYTGAVHVSGNGNRIIAEQLYKDIRDDL